MLETVFHVPPDAHRTRNGKPARRSFLYQRTPNRPSHNLVLSIRLVLPQPQCLTHAPDKKYKKFHRRGGSDGCLLLKSATELSSVTALSIFAAAQQPRT